MRFLSLLQVALVGTFVAVLPVSASPGLKLSISGPDSVNRVDNLKLVTTLVNTGDETLKLLNDPRGPLYTLPTDTFVITDAKGARPAFTGVRAKYVPDRAAALDDETVFTVLAPGQSVSITHDLSTTYNFTLTGEGPYTFEARNFFHIVDSNRAVTGLHATVDTHVTNIGGKLAIPRPTLQRRASFIGCSDERQALLNVAIIDAQQYASDAFSYLNAHTSTTQRYTTWFGIFRTSRYNSVEGHFTSISSNTFSTYTFDCTCTDTGIYAFVYPDQFGTVTLCGRFISVIPSVYGRLLHIFSIGAFWNAPATGTNSKAGTIIHESSHFTANGGTGDLVYGQSGCKLWALLFPNSAVENADSHEYFAENTPALS